ncbi:MAG: hypothetical protein EBS05_12805 [Proteobacteria bacterium]|nr:hypothetical protein [Pseudomonadota bacterium]
MKRLTVLSLVLCLLGAPRSATAATPTPDPVIFRFATVGDSRNDPEAEGLSGQDHRWAQNTRVLARICQEVEAQKPHAFFFNGDMIYGYTTNRQKLDSEYAFWRGMLAGMGERGVCVLPVPGNHEVQLKGKSTAGEATKTADQACEIAWRENMGDLILDTNRWFQAHGAVPTAWSVEHVPPIGTDGIKTDQRQLSYSFDFAGLHFAVINTDAVGADSHAPVTWLAHDLAAAQQRGAQRQFIFGHKMAYTYHYDDKVKPKGFDVFPENQQAFWALMEKFHATYFCGHEHIYHSMQPTAKDGGHAWQVIVGAGGSPFEAKPGTSPNPNDRQYSWANVKVHRSGRVVLEVSGFDEHFGPTHLLERLELSGPVKH